MPRVCIANDAFSYGVTLDEPVASVGVPVDAAIEPNGVSISSDACRVAHSCRYGKDLRVGNSQILISVKLPQQNVGLWADVN